MCLPQNWNCFQFSNPIWCGLVCNFDCYFIEKPSLSSINIGVCFSKLLSYGTKKLCILIFFIYPVAHSYTDRTDYGPRFDPNDLIFQGFPVTLLL